MGGSQLRKHVGRLLALWAGALPALAAAQAVSDASSDLQLPEPETLALLGAAAVAAFVVRRLRRK